MLQRDLLSGNSVCMVGSCRARLLHIIHVSAVSEVGVLQENYSQQPVPCGNFKLKLKLPPGLAAVTRLLRATWHRVNAPVVFLCFYFAARLSRHSRAACRVLCKFTLSKRPEQNGYWTELNISSWSLWLRTFYIYNRILLVDWVGCIVVCQTVKSGDWIITDGLFTFFVFLPKPICCRSHDKASHIFMAQSKWRVVMMPTLPSLVALEVVIKTTPVPPVIPS